MDYLSKFYKKNNKLLQFFILLIIFFLLCNFVTQSEDNIFWRLPPLIAGLPLIINDAASYLMYEFMPIDIYDPDIEELNLLKRKQCERIEVLGLLD